MAFCSNCGTQIADNAKFCSECGASNGGASNPMKRQQEYSGKIIKCPNCGEGLKSFATTCPACGHEIRATGAADSVREFAQKIEIAKTEQAKIDLVRTFPIPNAKEDIFEFMILASTNIVGESRKGLFDAWIAKFEQSYQKAQLVFSNEADFPQLQSIYDQTHQKIKREKRRRNAKVAGEYITKGSSDLPNVIISAVWIISLFALIIASTIDGDSYPVIFFFDVAVGAIIMPSIIKCSSNIPRLIVFFGLSLTIIALIIIIKFDLNSSGEDFGPVLLAFDIVATLIIVFRGVLKKPKENTGNNDGGNNHGTL